MSVNETVNELVQKEPWRTGQGSPRNILDPTWVEPPDYCDGEIDWEGTSRWWWCRKCGYCGQWTRTLHYAAELDPAKVLQESRAYYYGRRAEQGADPDNAWAQALYVCAVALRYAAAIPPERLGEYIAKLTG